MKTLLNILLCLLISCAARADEAASRQLAGRILELTDTAGGMRAGFLATIEPMISAMKQQGMPEEAAGKMRATIAEWFEQEIKWEEIRPKLIDLYVREFSEQELNELFAFYQTPTGRKAIAKLPVIMKQGAEIGQELATKKQDALKQRVQAIVEQYRARPQP